MGSAARPAAVAALLIALALGAAYLSARSDRLERAARQAALRQRRSDTRLRSAMEQLGALERRLAHREDAERAVLRTLGAEIERSLDANPDLQAARDAVRRLAAAEGIIARHATAVCVVQGAYGFGREVDGDWHYLREAEPELLADLDLEDDRVPLMLEGEGPRFTVEFTGTGFLVDSAGLVLTNRHIAEPWWRNEAAEPLLEGGYEPQIIHLRAYFPGLENGIDCDPGATMLAEDADLAILRIEPQPALPAPLTLADPDTVVAGRRVILLGYPSGLNALLARSEEGFAEQLTQDGEFDPLRILDALAARGLVRPLPTQGHIGDLVGDKVLFDAPTAVGGSGGPLLDLEGRVVGVNYGILKSFSGANFAVPIRHAVDLLDRARRQD